MAQYRKRPVVIEAIPWTGENADEVSAFGNSGPAPMRGADFQVHSASLQVEIGTLEGHMIAQVGDWIIRGVKGEFYPCKPDIFEATYERV